MITKINQRKKCKNSLFIVLCSLSISTAFCSCEDMFEPADENTRQEDAMMEESAYAHGLLMYGYDRLPYLTNVANAANWTDAATDDAVTNEKGNVYLNMAMGTWASDNNPMSQWDRCKDGIQYVNKFLSIVEKVKWAPSAESKQKMFIDRLKGEAFGLRAILYYYLLQAHGGYADDGILYGVPLLTEPEDGSSDFNQPRATFADCVKQCFADCDSAIALLPYDYVDLKSGEEDKIPAKYKELGANISGYDLVFGSKASNLISAKVAEAVKAQVALLAASPAFRDQSGISSAEAARLCAVVLNRIGGIAGFDMTGNIWYSSKNDTKLQPGASEMPEILWRENRYENTDQEAQMFPPSLYGLGRLNPSQNLVDAFPMRNGYPITDAKSGYKPNDPYAGRDPRLAETVIFNEATYRKTVIVTGTYPAVNGTKTEVVDNLNNNTSSTRTGYYLKKLLHENVNPNSSNILKQYHIYPRIRYTEIFLAYAEAANDAWGPTGDDDGNGYSAYDVIKKIRERASLGTNEVGMALKDGDAYLEECKDDKTKMTELIRNERRLELCFENKRFWDLRRWMLPLNETVKGMQVDRDATTNALSYTIIDVEERQFDSSYQWYGPIPKSEMQKWSNLKQNKGWK